MSLGQTGMRTAALLLSMLLRSAYSLSCRAGLIQSTGSRDPESDRYDSLTALKTEKVVTLSRSGWSYFQDLLASPTYVGHMLFDRLPPNNGLDKYLQMLRLRLTEVSDVLLDRWPAKLSKDRRAAYSCVAGIDVLVRISGGLHRLIRHRNLSKRERSELQEWREALRASRSNAEARLSIDVFSPDFLTKLHGPPRGWRALAYRQIAHAYEVAMTTLDGLAG